MSKLRQALQGVSAPSIQLQTVKGATFQGAPIQSSRSTGTNYTGQLIDTMRAIGGVADMYVDYRKKQGEERKNEILFKNMDRSTLGAMRADGTLLYQDDPYAMEALESELGRQEAYNVDAQVRERIARGDYNNREAMEKDRAELTNKFRTEMGKAYGIPETGSKAWDTGWQSDMTERNMALYESQARKQDEMMRNESRLVVENNLKDIIGSGIESSGVINYLNQMRANGVIRNDVEYENYLMRGLKDAANRPDGVAAVESMLNGSITIDGVETTLRSRIGEEAYQAYKLKAADNVFGLEFENQKWFMQGIDFITNLKGDGPNDFELGMDKIHEMEKQLALAGDTPAATSQKVELERAKMRLRDNLQASNSQKTKEIQTKIQQGNRYIRIRERVEQALAGEAVPLGLETFTESELTGKFESNDFASFHEQYTAELQNNPNLTPAQRQEKYLKVGHLFKSVDKAGFGAWYNAQFAQIERELQDFDLAAQYNQDAPQTPTLDTYKALYTSNPQMFMNTFGGDAATALDISLLSQMNIDAATYRKGKKTLASMSKEEAAFKTQQWMTAIDDTDSGKIIDKIPAQEQQAYMAFYAGLDGLGSAAKMKAITEHVNANYMETKVGDATGVVRKELLMLDPADPKSADQGKAMLGSFVQEMYRDTKYLSITSGNNQIIIRNAMGQVTYLTREELMNYGKAKAAANK